MLDLREHQTIEVGTERSFGFVFAAVFLLVCLWPVFYGEAPRWWAGLISIVFAVVAVLIPSIMRPLNILWFRLGLLLGRIVGPIVMFVVFVVAVVPTALILRLTGADLLKLKFDRGAKTYWERRGETEESSMRNQF